MTQASPSPYLLIPKRGLLLVFCPVTPQAALRAMDQWWGCLSFALWPTVGGIYTVLQTKAKVTGDEWGDNYYLVGPYTEQGVRTQVELLEPPTPELKRTLDSMNSKGCKVGHSLREWGGGTGWTDMTCQQGPSNRE